VVVWFDVREMVVIPLIAGALAGRAVFMAERKIMRRDRSNTRAIAGAKVDALLLENNVRAFLWVIRHGEQADAKDGINYRRMNGGELFTAPPWNHPRRVGLKGKSTAAGMFQFVAGTWDQVREDMKLTDFSPVNQTRAAVGLIAYRDALKDVQAGNVRAACKVLAVEWSSLPGGVQPRMTVEKAELIFTANGGKPTGR
jgi:muramidase (phage lysozyme)